MIDWLITWWSANGALFLVGSTVWLAAGLLGVKIASTPVARQRIAEAAVWGLVVWLLLSTVKPAKLSETTPLITVVHTSVPVAAPVEPVTARDEAPLVATEVTPAFAWFESLGLLLALGSAFAACYLLLGAYLVRRVVRRSDEAPTEILKFAKGLPLAPRDPQILISHTATRPFCCGLLRPHVVLPRRVATSHDVSLLRSILLHEFAHIAQRDLRGNALFALAAPLLYWNPLFHRLRRGARLHAEVVADDLAAACIGKSTYVRQLVALASSSPNLPRSLASTLPVVGPESEFFRRMNMLLTRTERIASRSTRIMTITRCLATIALAATASTAWSATVVAQTPAPDAERVTPPQQPAKTKPQGALLALKFEFQNDAQLGTVLTKLATRGFAIRKLEVAPPKRGAARIAWLKIHAKDHRQAMRTLQTPQFLKPVLLFSVAMMQPKKAQKIDPNAIRHAATRVNFAFENADVKKVVSAIAKISGSNIILPPTLQGKVTIHLRNVPVFKALETAVRQVGHTVKEEDPGILHIVPVPAKSDR